MADEQVSSIDIGGVIGDLSAAFSQIIQMPLSSTPEIISTATGSAAESMSAFASTMANIFCPF